MLVRLPIALAAVGLIAWTPLAQARTGPEGFADLVERVSPAVANVSVEIEAPMRLPDAIARPMAQGSGFVIDAAGHVVTNAHVIGQGGRISVTLPTGGKLPARLIGRDDKTDLALLKVEAAKPLPFVEFGNSDALRVGDWVVAVGNPFGLGGSVTAGIVSARGRDIEAGPYDDFLQIDAPINRGNSGGPLFDRDGKVVGINTAIFSPNGGSVGIGFAIPANLARSVIADLRADGRVERGFIGVQVQPVTPELADALGLPAAEGALIAAVVPNGPAAHAGLRRGDLVTGLGGVAIKTPRDLTRMVGQAKVGDALKLALRRRGDDLDVSVRVAPADDQPAAQAPRAMPRPRG